MGRMLYAKVYIYENNHDEACKNISSWKTNFVKSFRTHISIKPYIKKKYLYKALQKKIGTVAQYNNKEIWLSPNSNISKIVNGFCDITELTKYHIKLKPLARQQFIDKLSKFIDLECVIIIDTQVIYDKKSIKKLIP